MTAAMIAGAENSASAADSGTASASPEAEKTKANGFTCHTDQKFENGGTLVWGDGDNTTAYGHIGICYEGQLRRQNFNGDRSLHA